MGSKCSEFSRIFLIISETITTTRNCITCKTNVSYSSSILFEEYCDKYSPGYARNVHRRHLDLYVKCLLFDFNRSNVATNLMILPSVTFYENVREIGLEVSADKAKYMVMSRNQNAV